MAKTEKITLDKERTLRYPLMSIIKLKKEKGINLSDLADEEKAQDFEIILSIVWAGLIHEDPELTVEQLGNIIELSDMPEISEKLGLVFSSMEDKQLKK